MFPSSSYSSPYFCVATMFFYLITWVFEKLLDGWMTLEEYVIDPATYQCERTLDRYRYGESAVVLPHYHEDWSDVVNTKSVQPLSFVRYLGYNGESYVLLQEDYFEPIDSYVYDARWTIDGVNYIDVTKLLRQIAGPCGDMHGQELTLQDIVRFLAYNEKRCRGEYTSASQLEWTCGKSLTHHICTEWDEVLDFIGCCNKN